MGGARAAGLIHPRPKSRRCKIKRSRDQTDYCAMMLKAKTSLTLKFLLELGGRGREGTRGDITGRFSHSTEVKSGSRMQLFHAKP